MSRKILMVCTSGTSAVSGLQNVKDLLSVPEPVTDSQIFRAIVEDPVCKYNYEKRLSAAKFINNPLQYKDAFIKPDFGTSFLFPSAELQTILRWLSEVIRGEAAEIGELRIIMLPSQGKDSILTAKVTVVALQNLRALFPNIKLTCSIDNKGITPLSINVDTREEFLESISNLFTAFDDLINNKFPDEEIIICSTGGYKAVSGFAMMYAQLHSIPCLYSFEGSIAAYEVMSVPLGYAYAELDEEINMLKAVHRHAEINKESLPQWVKDSEKFTGALLKSYEHAREKPYGTGEELFRMLRKCDDGDDWAEYLQKLLINRWAYLWQGDQIPETVEHSRRHSKRLMELAANLFRCLGENNLLTGNDPRFLALLIAGIYLHDIGHTALSYPVIVDEENIFPLGLFPSAVRELHHILTGFVLESDPERYFMNDDKAGLLIKSVPLIAAHHRGYTVLRRGESVNLDDNNRIAKAGRLLLGTEKFNETLRPLEERSGVDLPVDILLNVTALLRVLDGCDVQSDRVISSSYLEYRNQRSSDEAKLLHAELAGCIRQLPFELQKKIISLRENLSEDDVKETCKKVYSEVFDTLAELKTQYQNWKNVQAEALPVFMALSMANKLAFKLEQHIHFRKHQSVGFVLPVMDKANNRVIIKVFPNEINDEFNAEREKNIAEIIKDIDSEYKGVKSVLDRINFPEVKAESAGGD